MIYNIHILRAVAALVVVFYHIASQAGLGLPFSTGAFGVDIFFVISGFIITSVGAKQPDAFFRRRLIRVVPFYWSATVVVFLVALLMPSLLRQTQPDVVHLIYSLFFIPHETSYSGVYPTLILGWTLNYEMYFYVAFSIGLLFSVRFAPVICSGLILVVMLALQVTSPASEALAFYGEPIVLEFLYGIGVCYIARSLRTRTHVLATPVVKLVLMICLLLALAFLAYQDVYEQFGLPRALVAGLPAFVLVLCAVLLEQVFTLTTRNQQLFLLGEASYILYLIHPYVVYGIIRLFIGSVDGWPLWGVVTLILGLIILPAILAVFIHLWFEKPLIRSLRRVLIRQ